MGMRFKTLSIVRALTAEDKVAPQVRVIVDSVIATHGMNVPVTMEQIVAAIGLKMTTRQPVERVVRYYLDQLAEKEIATLEKAETVKKEPKPKKEKAPKKDKSAAESPDGDIGDEDDDDDDGDGEVDEDEDEDAA